MLFLPDSVNSYYKASRFDWGSIMGQVTYKGCTFLQQWKDYNGEYRTTGKIDLITKNKNGEYFILDYKVSKSSEENINFYTPQLESYKYMFQRAFNIDERKINTGIIFLK